MFNIFWRSLFIILGLFFLAVFLFLICQNKNGQGLTLSAAILLLLLSRFDELKSIEFLTIKAEMRRTIDEAKATIEQLHNLAVLHSKIFMDTIQNMSRFAGDNFKEEQTRRSKLLLDGLRELGVGGKQIREVEAVAYPYECFDKSLELRRIIENSNTITKELPYVWKDFTSKYWKTGIGDQPSPRDFEEVLKQIKKLDDRIVKELKEYSDLYHKWIDNK